MQRALLLFLVVCAAGSGLWLLLWPARDSVPMVPLVSAMPVRQPVDVVTSPLPAHGAPDEPVDAPVRTSGPAGQTPAPASAACEVLLLDPEGRPLPGVEVGLSTAAGEPAAGFASLHPTDADGIARFSVPAGHGRQATAWSALGGEAHATLAADSAVRMVLRLAVRCWAEGSVVDVAGQGIADAELVLVPWQPRGGLALPNAQRVGRTARDGSFRIGLGQGGRLGALHREFSPSAMEFVPIDGGAQRGPKTATFRFTLVTLQAHAQGIVVEADGGPIAGAMLEFRPGPSTHSAAELPAPPQRTRTDAEGHFTVDHLLPGETTWAVVAPGFGAASGTFPTSPGETADLRLELTPAAAVEGTVTDAQGAPLADVLVHSGRADDFTSMATRTGADGTFHLGGLAAGDVALSATEPRAAGGPGRKATATLTLAAGEVARWNAILATASAGPVLRGTVVDRADRPLAGWRVTALGTGAATARTGPAGEFSIPFAEASAQVSVHAPDQSPVTFPAAHVPSAAPGPVPLRIVVDPAAPWAVLRGLVQSSAQQPVSATVSAWHHGLRRFARVQAGADGQFRIERVPAGRLDLYIDHAGLASSTRQGLDVAAGADVDLGVFELAAGAALHGTVTGPDGRPPEQLEIVLQSKDARIAGTYAGGSYRIGGAVAGRYQLQVQGPTVAGATFTVELRAGTELRQDIELRAGVPRRFEVAAPAAAGRFVSLALQAPDSPVSWHAGQARRGTEPLSFTACMAPGTYEVFAWGADGWSASGKATFAAGDDRVVRLELQPK